MKNLKLFILLAFISSYTLSFGQSKLEIGFEIGAGIPTLRGSGFFENNRLITLGYSGGVSLQYNLSESFALKTGLNFERKGSKQKLMLLCISDESSKGATSKFNLNYITVPVLSRFSGGEKVKYFVDAGMFVGYLLNAQVITEYFNKTETSNSTKYRKKGDFGTSIGIGALVPIKDKIRLSIELKNNHGFINIDKNPINDNLSIKTNITKLLIGLQYSL